MGKLPAEERPKVGQLVNEVKSRIESSIDEALGRPDAAAENQALEAGRFDLTRPGRQVGFGASHPLKQVERDILACLERLGFTVADGPQVEHDWYNFEALNIPEDHPARDMQDTFFLHRGSCSEHTHLMCKLGRWLNGPSCENCGTWHGLP